MQEWMKLAVAVGIGSLPCRKQVSNGSNTFGLCFY